MNEEKDLIVPIKEREIAAESNRAAFWRRMAEPRFIALSLLILVLAIFAAIYLISRRNNRAGQIVPAPRTVSFGQGDANVGDGANLSAEQVLTIAPEQVEQIKLETEIIGETLSTEAVVASSTGIVQANQYAETPIISLVGGVVKNVSAQLGEFVGKGETVAVVYSDELARDQSNYLTTLAESEEARKRYERSLQLSEVSQESRTELDSAEAELKIARAELVENRSNYERTNKLIQIGAASRLEFEQATTKLKTSQANLEAGAAKLERARKLLRINPERKNEIDRALTQLRTTEAKADAEREKLLVLGLSPQKILQIKQTRRVSSNLPIVSPVAGTVTLREVNSGEAIPANKELFKVTNLSTIWVIAEVYEKDLGRIRAGSGATIKSDAFPDRVFRGQVTYIDPNLNQTTRTAQVRVELENPGQIFKIGMYVGVAFGSMGVAERTAPVVSAFAVQTIGNRKIVFLVTEKPNVFILRQVRLGVETYGKYTVLEGVNVGDKVASEGSFLLRAEWLKQNSGGK